MIKYIIYVLVAGCSFGVLSTFVKLAYDQGFTLGEVTGAQAFFAAIILWSCCFLSGNKKKDGLPVTEKYVWPKLLLTGIASGLISLCYYQCVKLLPASVAIILLMQYTWMSMLLEKIFFKIPLGGRKLLCLIIILAGTVLAAGLLTQESLSQLSVKGFVFGLLAALCYAVFIIANGHIGNHFTALRKSAVISIGVCIIVFSIFPPVLIRSGSLATLTLWGMLLAIFGLVLPPVLFAVAIPRIGVSLSSILSAVELPMAVALSCFVLKEKVDDIQIIGVCLILLSIVLINVKTKKHFKQGPHQAK